MMKIPLTKGYFAVVDSEDYEYLTQYKWQYGANGYAVRDEYLGKIGDKYAHRTVLMHRVLTNAPKGMDVDHINDDKLDNRRSNLRVCTRSQNMANKKIVTKRNSELPMGVTCNPSPRTKQPYMARVSRCEKSYFLGNFYTVEEAGLAYMAKKKELFGEFA